MMDAYHLEKGDVASLAIKFIMKKIILFFS